MKTQYYGVERSSEYLEHYGVRGMKWGVRKAIERGDRQALSRHYRKAQVKLAKLSETARTGKGIAARRAAIGGASSALLSGATTYALNRLQGANRASSAIAAGTAALAGGAGGAILNAGRATNAEKRMAAQRRDKWKREMDRTFKGTGVSRKNNNSHKNYVVDLRSKRTREAEGATGSRIQQVSDREFKNTFSKQNRSNLSNVIGNQRSKRLYANAIAAQNRADELKKDLDRHPLDDLFNGRRSKAYTAARDAADNAHGAYMDSLSRKQRRRYNRRIEVVR